MAEFQQARNGETIKTKKSLPMDTMKLITEKEVIGACFDTYETIALCNSVERLFELMEFCYDAERKTKVALVATQFNRLAVLAESRACELMDETKTSQNN